MIKRQEYRNLPSFNALKVLWNHENRWKWKHKSTLSVILRLGFSGGAGFVGVGWPVPPERLLHVTTAMTPTTPTTPIKTDQTVTRSAIFCFHHGSAMVLWSVWVRYDHHGTTFLYLAIEESNLWVWTSNQDLHCRIKSFVNFCLCGVKIDKMKSQGTKVFVSCP